MLLDLSLSDSEPSGSPPRSAASLEGPAAARRGQEPPAAAPVAAAAIAGAASALQPAPLLAQGVDARLQQPPFAWLRALPRGELQNLRRCQSPGAAREALAAAVGLGGEGQAPAAPARLLEDLRRHTQAYHRLALDLEERLRRQAEEHEAELAALREEHRKGLRRSKLQLLAQCAPRAAAAREALTCEAQPSLAPVGAALAFGGYAAERLVPPLRRSASAGSLASRGGPESSGGGEPRARGDCVRQGIPF